MPGVDLRSGGVRQDAAIRSRAYESSDPDRSILAVG
jgi:hypothetical protein